MARRWKGQLAVEGVMTGDGREIAPGALTWATLPLPLGWLQQSQHGDGVGNPGAVDLGNIETAERSDGGVILGTGVIDDGHDSGIDFVRRLDEGTAPMGTRWGVSVDVDDPVIEIVDTDPEATAARMAEIEEELGAILASATGLTFHGRAALAVWTSSARPIDWWTRLAVTSAAGDPVPDHAEVVDRFEPGQFVMRMVSGRVRGATACPVPAFDDAWIELAGDTADTADDAPAVEGEAEVDPMTAAARFPVKPPARFFTHPEPDAEDDPRMVAQHDYRSGAYIGHAVPLTIVTDGPDRGLVYGHLAPTQRCHIGIDGMCQVAPESGSAYAQFHLGEVHTADGKVVPTGALVVGCDHAPHSMTMGQALDHYANTGLAWADVRVTDGRFGPWVCGALRPDVTDELVRTLRGGGISGDWRAAAGRLELIAVQAVNTPGFTVQRVGLAASARLVELRPWAPWVEVAGDEVSVSTPPVLQASAVQEDLDVKPCGCHDPQPTASELMAELRAFQAEQRAHNRAMDARTRHLRVEAAAIAASALRR